MNLKNRLFGFSTKDLYLAQLTKKYDYTKKGITYYGVKSLTPRKFVLVRKYSDYSFDLYKDIFTKSKYHIAYDDSFPSNGTIIVQNLRPVVSNKKRIKYKDAEKILKTKNTVYIKK